MADARDLKEAMNAAMLRVTAVEERYIISNLSEAEKRLNEFTAMQKHEKDIKEPYEFN